MSDGVYLWFLLQNEITITAQQYVNLIQVAIAQGFHLFPFRTEKLSLVAPMVLRNSGRVGRRHLLFSPVVFIDSRTFVSNSISISIFCFKFFQYFLRYLIMRQLPIRTDVIRFIIVMIGVYV